MFRSTATAIVILAWSLFALADPPSPDETKTFNDVMDRVNTRFGEMPKSVSDGIQSLDGDCLGFSVLCPPDNHIGATYTVCTRLVAWTANPQSHDEAAAYIWDSSPDVDNTSDPKLVRFDNEIMIDISVFQPNEDSGSIGRLLNEGLLYHELLHGQLGIDSLLTDANVSLACGCNTPDAGSGADGDHDVIPGLQDTFLSDVGALENVEVEVNNLEVEAGEDGSFEVDLGDKNGWTGSVRVPEGGNIAELELTDPNNDGSIVVRGKLSDATKKGHIMVLIDPAALYIYDSITVLPAGPLVPTGGVAGKLFLMVAIMTSVYLISRRESWKRARASKSG